MTTRPDTIFIRNLEFEAILGIYPRERTTPQRVRFDLMIETDTARAAASGRIEDTVDYAALADEIRALTVELQAQLVEALVEKVAAQVLQHEGVCGVEVQVTKPDALSGPTEVGLRIYRAR